MTFIIVSAALMFFAGLGAFCAAVLLDGLKKESLSEHFYQASLSLIMAAFSGTIIFFASSLLF